MNQQRWWPKKRQPPKIDAIKEHRCTQCNEVITMTNLVDVLSFCNSNCLRNWLMDNWEEGLPRKDDTLAAIEYEQQREEF